MSTKIDEETQRRLESGDVQGETLVPKGQFDEGVTVEKTDGQQVFLGQAYLQAMKLRNRGKD